MIVVDSGPLLATAHAEDQNHARCSALLGQLRQQRRHMAVPAPVVIEVCQLLERRKGAEAEAAFLRLFVSGQFTLVDLLQVDYARALSLVEQYADLPLGMVDASVVAVAERLRASTVATLDHRHFSVVRPHHVRAFTLLPEP